MASNRWRSGILILRDTFLLKRIKIILFGFVFFLSITINAQKQTEHLNQVWLAYNNQTRYTKHFGSWTDIHLRTKEDFFTNFSQSILRFGLTYYVDDFIKLTAGYAYVSIYPADNHPGVTQPEHRPLQQVQWHNRYAKLRTMQWIRLEERFRRKILNSDELASGYSFNYRLRYNFLIQVPLGKKKFQPNSFSFVLNNEVHVNFGKQIIYNYFDQNRFFAGFSYQPNKTDQLQFGYMNLFQQLAAGNKYKSINAARVFYFHNLDLRKKAG